MSVALKTKKREPKEIKEERIKKRKEVPEVEVLWFAYKEKEE
jgi:hypothetical protein